MIRVGIAGAAGYTAGELIRVLISHPQVELRYLQSESHRGEPVGRVHRDLIYTNLKFSDLDLTGIDVLFLCMGHGMSAQFLERHPVPASVRIIDLSHDFRLKSNAGDFIYGLPELNRERIQGAWHVANPGCFATAIELGLLPLAKSGLLPAHVSVFGITGATGAGQKPTEETHYSHRAQNLSVYNAFSHQLWLKYGKLVRAMMEMVQTVLLLIPVRGCRPGVR